MHLTQHDWFSVAAASTSAFTPFGAAWAAFGYSFPKSSPSTPEVKHLALGCSTLSTELLDPIRLQVHIHSYSHCETFTTTFDPEDGSATLNTVRFPVPHIVCGDSDSELVDEVRCTTYRGKSTTDDIDGHGCMGAASGL